MSKERLSQLKAVAKNLILDINHANELFDCIESLQRDLHGKEMRLSEYSCAWNRQQGVINNLSEALVTQEKITLNELKDYFTCKGFLNSIQPDELESYISKVDE